MGLIKAGISAVGGVFADQWKEFIYCEALPNNVLMRKGQKRTGRNSSNTKGNSDMFLYISLFHVKHIHIRWSHHQYSIAPICGYDCPHA